MAWAKEKDEDLVELEQQEPVAPWQRCATHSHVKAKGPWNIEVLEVLWEVPLGDSQVLVGIRFDPWQVMKWICGGEWWI